MVSIPTESEFCFLGRDTKSSCVQNKTKYRSYAIPTESDFGFLRYRECVPKYVEFDSSGI